jgi:hypothetical protein
MERYHVVKDTKCRLTCTFYDISNALADPTTVTFSIKLPAGTTTSYIYGTDAELVRASTGVYYVDFLFNAKGAYIYRFLGAGSVGAPGEGTVDVAESALA